jgi:CDP-glucose 4,6-dehydratase
MEIKSFWRDRNVFVTGSTGFLGQWLTADLLRAGANVVVLVRDSIPRRHLCFPEHMDRVTVVRGELEDYPLLERSLNEYEIETVFHLAAQAIVGIANRSPLSTFESNIRGTWQLLEACRRASTVKRIVLASSDKAYGEQKTLPYDESMPLQGSHPYDVSKSCADLIAATYFKTYRLPVCVTRCGNFYGGGDLNFNRIVPGTIRSVFRGQRPVIRSNGTLVRDYFYVRDGAAAYMMLAEQMLEKGAVGEAFNFSNETQTTVRDLVRMILRLMGKSRLQPVILNEAQHEIGNQHLSAAKARSSLGWKPRYTLEQGLKEAITWYRKFLARKDG